MTDARDLELMIRSRTPLIVVESHDEKRVLELVASIAMRQGSSCHEWTAVRGLERGGLARSDLPDTPRAAEPEEVLTEILRRGGPAIYALCDFHPYFRDEPKVVRLLREIALDYDRLHCTILFISHRLELPAELSRLSARFELALPDSETLMAIVREQAEDWARAHPGQRVRTDRATLERLISSLRGVNEGDARRLIRHAIFTDGAIAESDLPAINRLKFELIGTDGILALEYDTPKLVAVAGLGRVERWLDKRRQALAGEGPQKDRPKGILLLGVQGGGKSLAARCIAGELNLPLLRLDFGALYNKFIGETERNLRESLRQAESMAPCVLWMDEIEKGIDVRGSDNSTSRRVLGTLLTWLAENDAPVFVTATANDIEALPPELLRKGRLDEIFFVDLPGPLARRQILQIHLRKRDCDPDRFDLDTLVAHCDGFTGAEIEQAVVSARYAASSHGSELDTEALRRALDGTVPLSVTMAEPMARLRAWARERTVPADD